MLARNEVIFKWTLYSLAALLCFFVQTAFLQRFTLWGVIPFLYPLIAAVPATFEAPVPGTIFALGVGVLCDLLLPGVIPCFHTLLFPVIGLVCSLLSRSLLPAGFICSLAAATIAFLLCGLFHTLLLVSDQLSVWGTALSITLREFLVTLPLVFPVTFLFRAVFRKTHIYD